jgi:hypothetical protein
MQAKAQLDRTRYATAKPLSGRKEQIPCSDSENSLTLPDSSPLAEAKDSLLCSQESAIGPCSEQAEHSPHNQPPFYCLGFRNSPNVMYTKHKYTLFWNVEQYSYLNE